MEKLVIPILFFTSFCGHAVAPLDGREAGVPEQARSCGSLPRVTPIIRASHVGGALPDPLPMRPVPEKQMDVIRPVLPILEARAARAAAQIHYAHVLHLLERALVDFSNVHKGCLRALWERMAQDPGPSLPRWPRALSGGIVRQMLCEVSLHLKAMACREKATREILSAPLLEGQPLQMDQAVLRGDWHQILSHRMRLRRILGEESDTAFAALPKGLLWDRLQVLEDALGKTRCARERYRAAQEAYKDAMFPGHGSDLHQKPIFRIRSPDLGPETRAGDTSLPLLVKG